MKTMVNKAFWEKLHGKNELEKLAPPDALLSQYQAYIPMGNVLDIGAGYGRNGLFFSMKNYPVTITDVSKNALDKGKKLAARLELKANFRQMGALDDRQFREGHYNLIICASLLQFFLKADREALALKMCRSLNLGGFLYFSSFSVEDDSLKQYKKRTRLLEPNTVELEERMTGPVHYFSEKEVAKLFGDLKLISLSHRKYFDSSVDAYVGVINYMGMRMK